VKYYGTLLPPCFTLQCYLICLLISPNYTPVYSAAWNKNCFYCRNVRVMTTITTKHRTRCSHLRYLRWTLKFSQLVKKSETFHSTLLFVSKRQYCHVTLETVRTLTLWRLWLQRQNPQREGEELLIYMSLVTRLQHHRYMPLLCCFVHILRKERKILARENVE